MRRLDRGRGRGQDVMVQGLRGHGKTLLSLAGTSASTGVREPSRHLTWAPGGPSGCLPGGGGSSGKAVQVRGNSGSD